jgi:uncharacterized protein YbjT (DUF2867 family)
MQIAVAGGTGWVGSLVVEQARAAGHQPVVIARSAGVDLITGAGLDAALSGASVVIDVSNTATMRRPRSIEFFETATRNLLAAGQRAGVAHHVALSIVGIDRVPLGYYAGKLRQESLLEESNAPVTILRATQFHEFVPEFLARIPRPLLATPVLLVPQMRTQPVAAREVAAELVRIAARQPAGRVPDMAGPEPLELADLVRRVLHARGRSPVVRPVRIPGRPGRAMAGGALLPTGPGPRGRQTFGEWLASQAAAGGRAPAGSGRR